MFRKKRNKTSLRIQAMILSFIMFLTFIVPARGTYALEEGTSQTEDKDQTENIDIVRTIDLKYMLNGATEWDKLVDPYKIEDGTKIEKFQAQYSFQLNETMDDEGAAKRTMKSGDYYLINLPDKLNVINPDNGSILGNDNKPIATYNFLQKENGLWQIKIQFTDYIDNSNEFEIKGNFGFEFAIDLSSVGDGQSTQIRIPIDNKSEVTVDVTKPTPPPTKPISLEKTVQSYDHSTRELVWNVKMMPEIGGFSGCIFTDTIDVDNLDLKTIKHGDVTLVEGTDYTFDKITGELKYTIPEGRDGNRFQNINITTVAKRNIYGSNTSTTITNKAHLSGGESSVEIDSNIATQTITPEWLKKTGTSFEGNKILWTINANITNQLMYDGVITDKLAADVKLDKESVKLDNTKIKVYDNTYTPSDDKEIYGIHILNSDDTAELKIYLPRGKENASNAMQTVTLVTDIVAPDKKTEEDQVYNYNNEASLDGKYVTDGDGEGKLPTINSGTIGVPVPYLYIDKSHSTITAEDKRNGTITWTISAQSNLTDYGKSQIVDILPDDQDYIVDEIYWGDSKINKGTEPKAEISEDGRKLTITFSKDGALQTKQNFKIKTKIKEDVYGENINRDFTNEAKAYLYPEGSNDEVIVEAEDTDTVKIQNTVISKSSTGYTGNKTGNGENPRVNFNITINSNLMPLNNVIVTDDLNKLITEFKKDNESYQVIKNVKWTYVPDTLKLTKSLGTMDKFDLSTIVGNAKYENNIITVDFGKDVQVNDKYTLSFTAELDISQNNIFKENGIIRSNGNIADITAGKLNGKIESPATGSSTEIKNEVLEKLGTLKQTEQQILWTINLNQHRVTLNNTKVEDILPKGLTLDPTSIKLYTKVIGKDGNFITGDAVEIQGEKVDFSYDYLPATGEGMEDRYKLIVDLPENNTDYILRFATDIDKSILGQKISNTAYYVGESGTTQNSDTSVMTLSSSAGGSSTNKASITVNKKSKDNNTNLTGAVFALHWLKGGNKTVFVRNLTAVNGQVIFKGLTRGEKYTITEIGAPDGYILDSKDPVEFKVPSESTVNPDDIEFYNTPIKTGSWIPEAIKKLDGKAIIRPFQFEISDGTTTIMKGVTKNKLSNDDYTIEFAMSEGLSDKDILSFTDDHIFNQSDMAGTEYVVATKKLYMKETSATLPGYGFDKSVHELIVKVINVKGQANLKIVVEDGKGNKLTDDSGKFIADKIPYFQNTYRANGSIQVSAEKNLIGHELTADQFSFDLYEGNTLIETISNKEGRKVDGNTYTANIDFTPIKYTQSDVGVKTYKILESNTNVSGYTYDPAVYTFEVNIVDNDDGTISSTIQNIKKTVDAVETDESKIQFNNTYKTADIDVNLIASKVLKGRTLEDNQFSFTLNQVNSEGELIAEIGTFKNNNSNINFPKFNYKQSDIGLSYYYQVKEVNDGKSGYTYDSSIYTVKVDILDNHDGSLSTTQSITKDGENAKEITFTNNYKSSGKTQIIATKTLTGKALANNQFSFALQQIDALGGADVGEKIVAKNDAKGNIVFPEIEYTEADGGKDFYYKVSEVSGGMGGYTYDSTVYNVLVSVTDNGDGTLTVKQSLVTPTDKTNIEFANSYVTSDLDVKLTASKILTGRTLEDKQFSFTLNQVNSKGELITEIGTFKNNNSNIDFPQFNYKQSDIGSSYYYQVKEVNDGKSGYTYDSSIYTVKVDILDNHDGSLSATRSITKDGENVKEITFTNNYEANGKTQIIATKTLTGKDITNNQFSFVLQQVDALDGAEVGERVVVRNDAKGNIVFPEIEYTEVDEGKDFYYKVFEINEGAEGYTYDSTVYTIAISVKDNGNGTLRAQQRVVGPKDKTDIKFENIYTTSNSNLGLNGIKVLKGHNLEAGQFTFALNKVTEEGDLLEKLQEVKNNKDGTIKFDDVIYTQEDMGETYYYQLLEVNDKKPGYVYDSSVYNIKVEIVDNNDGTMKTVYAITKSGDDSEHNKVDNIEFSNSYTSKASVQLNAKKVLEGMKLTDKMFGFKLMDEKGENTLQTIYNDENGDILFDDILFTEDQIGIHKYVIREVNDNKSGITYDEADYIVTIHVTDNGDGTLKTKTSIVKSIGFKLSKVDDIQFVNKYKSDVSNIDNTNTDIPYTGDNSNIFWYISYLLFSIGALFLIYRRKIKN